MRSWTEDFGKFYTNSNMWDSIKKICISYKNDTTGEEMVRMAISLAKKYNCRIVGQVEYTPETVGGTVHFTVECHQLTYRYFYDGGSLNHLHSPRVTEKDLQRYEEQFGTLKCSQKNYKKQYYFTDNWNGSLLYFNSLKKAKEVAESQIGDSVCIYETRPYGRGSQIVCFATASGITPP